MFPKTVHSICVKKQFASTLLKLFAIQSTIANGRAMSSVSADKILTKENQNKCIHCMQSLPSVAIKYNSNPVTQRFAAVLIPICVDKQGGTSILYTRRTGKVSRHIHQISFPGGIVDSTDIDYIDCALRETEEEIGLPRSRVEVWGTGSLIRSRNTAAIMPVFGTVHTLNMNELKLNKHEVEEAFTIDIAKLAASSSLRQTQYRAGYVLPTFIVEKYRVWGITGFITYNFLKCLLPKDIFGQMPKIRYVKPYKREI